MQSKIFARGEAGKFAMLCLQKALVMHVSATEDCPK